MKIDDLKNTIGFGIAGNFAKHLEQAGELRDFVNIKIEEGAPKGIFPFYLPQDKESFLHTFPLSNKEQNIPKNENPQLEPELALLCEIIYEGKKVVNLKPLKFAAFNDCTIRKEGAKKISEKKNWGVNSKGVSDTWLDIDTFSKGGVLDGYRLASFLKRDGKIYEYGVDTEVLGYSYFYTKVIHWIIEKFNTQIDQDPLEDLSLILERNGYPKQGIISIGATAYADFGEKNYLKEKDKIFVVIYPKEIDNIVDFIEKEETPEKSSMLIQEVKEL